MAASGDVSCDICDGLHVRKNAEYWCPECQEGLCSECQERHNISRYTKHHEVISVDNYKKVPPSISKLPTYCEEHNQRFQNYCPKHESLCCPLCIATDHKKCTDLQTIEDVIKTSKTSVILDRLDESLKNLTYNIKNLQEDREQNLKHIEDLRKSFRQDIEDFHAKINSHLDTLKENFLREFDIVTENTKSKIESVIKEVAERKKSIEQLSGDVVAVKHFASSLQTYLGSKQLEFAVEEEENFMKSLSEDGRIQYMTLKWNINEKIKEIFSCDAFGSCTMEPTAPKVTIRAEKEKQAQIIACVIEPRSKPFQDIQLTFKSKFHLPIKNERCGVTGCSISPNGKMIFADNGVNNRLILLNNDGKLIKEIPYEFPCDVSFLDDTTAVISNLNGITKINILSKDPQCTNVSTGSCFGVTYDSNHLGWCTLGNGIRMKNLSGSDISNITSADGQIYWSYITLYKDRIYVTNPRENKVSCYRMNGEKVWQFKDESFLKKTHGVDVDENCNVYVASTDTQSIVVISYDGKYAKQILCNSDDVNNPWAVCVDRVRNQLLVTDNNKETVCLYSI